MSIRCDELLNNLEAIIYLGSNTFSLLSFCHLFFVLYFLLCNPIPTTILLKIDDALFFLEWRARQKNIENWNNIFVRKLIHENVYKQMCLKRNARAMCDVLNETAAIFNLCLNVYVCNSVCIYLSCLVCLDECVCVLVVLLVFAFRSLLSNYS